jgi:DBP10CT (NUC160) domain
VPSRRGGGAGHAAVPGVRAAPAHERAVEVMRAKRGAHGRAIRAHRSELSDRAGATAAARDLASDVKDAAEAAGGGAGLAADVLSGAGASGAELGTGRFREEGFFIAGERADRHEDAGYAIAERGQSAIAAEVMDLNAEDAEGLAAQQRRRTVWDAKKKRYVTLQAGEEVRAGKRVATGGGPGSVKGGVGKKAREEGKGRLYKQWVKQVGGKAAEALGKDVKGGHSALADRCAVLASGSKLWFHCCARDVCMSRLARADRQAAPRVSLCSCVCAVVAQCCL